MKPQRLCSLPTRFLFSILRIGAVHGMAPQNAVDDEFTSPFGGSIRMSVTFEDLHNFWVGWSAFGFIALTVLVDDLCWGHLWGYLCRENSNVVM
jgi:hypothetical protein